MQVIQHCPDEAAEFSGDSRDGNVSVIALIEVPELFG
jgi:hypothetical protein